VELDKNHYAERQADRDNLEHLRRGQYVYLLTLHELRSEERTKLSLASSIK